MISQSVTAKRSGSRTVWAAAIALACGVTAQSPPPPTVVTTNNPLTLAQTLVGSGITIVGTPTFVGSPQAAGTFTGGPVSTIGFSSGILLTTGLAASAASSYAGADLPSTDLGYPGDPGLTTLVGNSTFDATVLQFSFTSTAPTVFFKYTFASAEYPTYENSNFNDVFAFYVNGVNYALIPNTQLPVSVNAVNSTQNSQYFRGYNTTGSPSPYGGQTVVLTFSAPVSTTSVNTIRLAIADTSDSILDSAVFIQAGSFSTTTGLSITGTCPGTVPAGGSYSLAVTGSGGSGTYSWTLAGKTSADPAPAWLTVTPTGTTTATVSGTPPGAGSFPFTVILHDSAGTTPAGTFSCTVVESSSGLNVSGACPTALPNSPYTIPLTVSGGSGTYAISFTGAAWLTLSASQGPAASGGAFPFSLSGTTPAAGSFPVTVKVTDTAGAAGSFTCTVAVITPPVQITSKCPVSPIAQGTPFIYDLTASGGGKLSWTVLIGSLPAGLNLRSDGRIYGTPSGPPGTTSFTLEAFSGYEADQMQCSITVTAPALQISSACPGNGTQGVSYGPFQLAATGAAAPASYTFATTGSLPPGVTLNGSTIAGTPLTAGTYNFGIQVSSGAQTVSTTCSVKIAGPLLALAGSCPASSQDTGVPISASFTATGGKAPYTYSFTGPAWLSQSNGTVSGTAPAGAAGPTSFAVTVTDAASASKTITCPLTIAAAATISPSCPAKQRAAGSVLTIPLSVTGGQAPFTWSYDNRDPDLALSSGTGATTVLTGTLKNSGPFTFTVSLTDGAGVKAPPLTCSVQVGPAALTITPGGVCPAAQLDFGSKFTQTYTGSGGVPPYSWAVSPADLFSVNPSTGPSTQVSAALSKEGPVGLTVTLTDSANSTPAVFSCPLAVLPAPVPSTTLSVGTTTQDLTQAGAPVTLSLAAPTPIALSGELTLTFVSQVDPAIPNPEVTFTGGGTTLKFDIPANSSTIPAFTIQRGTVAGTIHVTVTKETTAQGRDVLPSPAPSVDIVVPKLAPVFTVAIQDTSAGFDITVQGYSTTRDITGGTITFNAASDATIDGSTVDLSTANLTQKISAYYADGSQSLGTGQFHFTVHVSVSGDKSAIASVKVTLTNSAPGSTTVTQSR